MIMTASVIIMEHGYAVTDYQEQEMIWSWSTVSGFESQLGCVYVAHKMFV